MRLRNKKDLGVVLKILNRYFNALATTMEAGAVNDTQRDFNEELEQRSIFVEERVEELSEVAHAPEGRFLYK